jgi:hypothetical protein
MKKGKAFLVLLPTILLWTAATNGFAQEDDNDMAHLFYSVSDNLTVAVDTSMQVKPWMISENLTEKVDNTGSILQDWMFGEAYSEKLIRIEGWMFDLGMGETNEYIHDEGSSLVNWMLGYDISILTERVRRGAELEVLEEWMLDFAHAGSIIEEDLNMDLEDWMFNNDYRENLDDCDFEHWMVEGF